MDEAVKIDKLQNRMLRIQQGVWHRKKRVILCFEGMDAAGKGGAIRRLTEKLDPRGVKVHPIGPPSAEEQGKHYLYRFWKRLPAPGTIAIFDRSWYGRVLVERVDKLIEKDDWKRAYSEINEFEKTLIDDGVEILKFFLDISKKEQLKRFEDRLKDPYKQWKLTSEDVRNHKKWDEYQKAIKAMLEETDTKACPWNFISADDKSKARLEVLEITTKNLKEHANWLESKTNKHRESSLKEALRELGATL